MSSDLSPVMRTAAEAAVDGPTYGAMLASLAAAGAALTAVGERVRATYDYVGDCASSVEHLADLAARLGVDPDTLGEHRDAAAAMRAALGSAQRMAGTCEAMAALFAQATAAHQADYGQVAEAARAMPTDMADRRFYRNR